MLDGDGRSRGVCPGERENNPQAFDGLVSQMACSETEFATVKVCPASTVFSKRVYTVNVSWFVSSRLFAHHYTFPNTSYKWWPPREGSM